MSHENDMSPDMGISCSQAKMVQACDENGASENEEVDIMETTPLPPVGSVTASSSFADLSDNDSELLELTVSRLADRSDTAKVEFESNKAENDELANLHSQNDQTSRSQEICSEIPPFSERMEDSDLVSNSKACQTEWSWLAAYRAIKHKLPQQSSSILNSKSGSKISKTSVAEEKPASSLSENPDHVPRMLESLKSDPWPDRADEYGIPIRNPSEDGEELDDTLVPHTVQEEKNEAESKHNEDETEESEDEEEEETEESLEQILVGICKFCGQEKKPFPSLEDQETKSPEEIYCCRAFREYVTRTIARTGQHKSKKVKQGQKSEKVKQGEKSKKIEQGRRSRPSSAPRPLGDEGSEQRAKTRRKSVKAGDRTPGRSSSRSEDGRRKSRDEKKKSPRESEHHEDEFHRSTHSRQHSRASQRDDDTEKPCIVYGHETTTINYQLSSRQCMAWTVGLDSGATIQQQPETVHVIEPVQLQGRSHCDPSTGLLCQTYQTGSLFLIIFSDGSGNVFYPSGQIAVSIISAKDSKYTYIIQDTNGRLLGIYEPSGRTVTYYQNGSIRVFTDEAGGLELDSEGNRRKHWKWNEKVQHIHAPPLYAITCSISSFFTFSILSQHEMTLLFNRSHRACRFNVGSRPHGVYQKKQSLLSDVLNETELYINEAKSRIRGILQKTSVLFKHPTAPRLQGTLTPVPLQKRRGTPSSKTSRKESRILPAITD